MKPELNPLVITMREF